MFRGDKVCWLHEDADGANHLEVPSISAAIPLHWRQETQPESQEDAAAYAAT